jgi:hypothetical protein
MDNERNSLRMGVAGVVIGFLATRFALVGRLWRMRKPLSVIAAAAVWYLNQQQVGVEKSNAGE